MAPPKRKTGGRVTAAGTNPAKRSSSTAHSGASVASSYDSGRYTAPISQLQQESPPWVPALMLALFVVGALAIIARYLFWDSNIPMILGMAALLGGLYTATKWR